MSIEFLEAVHVRAQIEGVPLAGAWIRATLLMSRKNNFNFLVGPTGEDGEGQISREELLQQVDATRNLFLMDYPGIADWTGTIVLRIMNGADLRALSEASELWGWGPGRGLEPARGDLERLAESLDARSGARLELIAWTEPTGAAQLETEAQLT